MIKQNKPAYTDEEFRQARENMRKKKQIKDGVEKAMQSINPVSLQRRLKKQNAAVNASKRKPRKAPGVGKR